MHTDMYYLLGGFVALLLIGVIIFAMGSAFMRGQTAPSPSYRNVQVMLDLETLGLESGCKILSIGACVFTERGVEMATTFHQKVKRNTGQEMLLEDPNTVIFWNEQPVEAKVNLLVDREGDDKLTLTDALIAFNKWLVSVGGTDSRGNTQVDVWGNGSDFDNVILAAAYKAVGVRQGWPFWGNSCYRSLKKLTPAVKFVRNGVHHNALDDAVSQAEHAVRIFKDLDLWAR